MKEYQVRTQVTIRSSETCHCGLTDFITLKYSPRFHSHLVGAYVLLYSIFGNFSKNIVVRDHVYLENLKMFQESRTAMPLCALIKGFLFRTVNIYNIHNSTFKTNKSLDEITPDIMEFVDKHEYVKLFIV